MVRCFIAFVLMTLPALATDADFEHGAASARRTWAERNCPAVPPMRPHVVEDAKDYDDGYRAAEKELTVEQKQNGRDAVCRNMAR